MPASDFTWIGAKTPISTPEKEYSDDESDD